MTEDRKKQKSVFGALRWAAAVSFSALIGGLIADYLSRPKLAVVGVDFATKLPRGSVDETYVQPNPALVTLTAGNNWLGTFEPSLTISQYADQIGSLKKDAQELIRETAQLRQALAKWPVGKGGCDAAHAAFDVVHSHLPLLIGHLFPEVRRTGMTLLVPVNENAAGDRPCIAVRTDDDGDFSLAVGVRAISIPWTPAVKQRFGVLRDETRETARRLATSISVGSLEGLAAIKAEFDKILRDEGSARDFIALAEKELLPLSYVQARVTLVNAGRQPIAVSADAALYLDWDGITVKPDGGDAVTLSDQLRVPLQRMATQTPESTSGESKDESSEGSEPEDLSAEPILVRAGEAISVTFRSLDSIRTHPQWQALASLYTKPQVLARIAVVPIEQVGSPDDMPRYVVSGKYVFGNTSANTLFPKQLP